jgi:hypothetical protein
VGAFILPVTGEPAAAPMIELHPRVKGRFVQGTPR